MEKIIIITGASHTGKTLLAQRLLEQFKYSTLSIDHLKMGLIRSGYTPLTPEEDDSLTEYLWPVVREIIKTAIENQQNLIVEGCYIPFDWKRDFPEKYLSSIRYVCLVMTDHYIDIHFDVIRNKASVIEHRKGIDSCSLQSLKTDNRTYQKGCEANGEKFVCIDDNYEETLDALINQMDAHEGTL